MVHFLKLQSTWNPRFIEAIKAHYTGSKGPPVGKKMAWEVFENEQHIGWLGLGEPAYKLAARRRLGLMDARPLPFTVSNFIYRLDAPHEAKASAILKRWHDVAVADWEQRYGWKPVHWETLVDPAEVNSQIAGGSFRRAGYRSLGMTTGRTARRPPGHTHGPRVWADASPKLVLYRGPLVREPRVAA